MSNRKSQGLVAGKKDSSCGVPAKYLLNQDDKKYYSVTEDGCVLARDQAYAAEYLAAYWN